MKLPDPRTLRWCARKLRAVERQANKHTSEYSTGMAVCAHLLASDFLETGRAIGKRRTKKAGKRS